MSGFDAMDTIYSARHTPEDVAAMRERDMATAKRGHKASTSDQAVYTCSRDGDAAGLKRALQSGVCNPSCTDKYGCSALFVAARRGSPACFELLLAAQADVNQANKHL